MFRWAIHQRQVTMARISGGRLIGKMENPHSPMGSALPFSVRTKNSVPAQYLALLSQILRAWTLGMVHLAQAFSQEIKKGKSLSEFRAELLYWMLKWVSALVLKIWVWSILTKQRY